MRLRGRRRRHTLQRVCRRYILALTCDYLANNDTRSRVRGADRPHAGRTRGDARNPPRADRCRADTAALCVGRALTALGP